MISDIYYNSFHRKLFVKNFSVTVTPQKYGIQFDFIIRHIHPTINQFIRLKISQPGKSIKILHYFFQNLQPDNTQKFEISIKELLLPKSTRFSSVDSITLELMKN